MSRIMIVDDEEGILKALRRLLLRAPCSYGRLVYTLEVETFVSPHAALDRARVAAFDLVLSDYHMPRMDGVQFLRQIEEIQPDAARMILSGCSDINVINQSIHRADIYGMLPKPWNDYFLMSMIAQALNHRELLLENRELARKAQIERAEAAPAPPAAVVEWAADGSMVFADTAADAVEISRPS
ncbi:MAG: response regulator [Rhodocyclales bacterium]|nr:response regulator [Rhodocyclales bacterium]